ncbi:hypothetical protein ACYSNR_03880 [Enterococcus sp. LJL128]|uniref:hypothetical protein n=1 Tax=Enterococcus sp. LJL51 TaxID=3416656 RepID=UPI003CFAEF4E
MNRQVKLHVLATDFDCSKEQLIEEKGVPLTSHQEHSPAVLLDASSCICGTN